MAQAEWSEVWAKICKGMAAEEQGVHDAVPERVLQEEQGKANRVSQGEKVSPFQAQIEPVFSWDDVSVEFCHTLWMAVLKRAVEEYGIFAKDEEGKIPAIAAERWIHSDMTSPGSLLWLCDMFDFDVVAIRTRYPKRIGDCSVCDTHNCKECVMAQQELL